MKAKDVEALISIINILKDRLAKFPEAFTEIEEEREAFDELSEKVQESEKGEARKAILEALESGAENFNTARESMAEALDEMRDAFGELS